MAYLLAALGGALGALARWGIAEALPSSPTGWQWATLLGGVVYGLQKVDDRIFGEDVEPGEAVTVRIPEGSNSDEIAHIRDAAGVATGSLRHQPIAPRVITKTEGRARFAISN